MCYINKEKKTCLSFIPSVSVIALYSIIHANIFAMACFTKDIYVILASLIDLTPLVALMIFSRNHSIREWNVYYICVQSYMLLLGLIGLVCYLSIRV